MFYTLRWAKIGLTAFLLLVLSSLSVLAEEVNLSCGTPVKLRLLQAVIGGKNKVDEAVILEVYESVCDANGWVLIPVGAKASGRVTKSSGAKNMGQNGALELSIDTVKAIDNGDVPLSATYKVKNPNIVATMVLLTGIATIFSKGLTAVYPEGKLFTVYVAEQEQKLSVNTSSKLDIAVVKPDIVVSDGKLNHVKVRLFKKTTFTPGLEVKVRNNGNAAVTFCLTARTMSKDAVTDDSSVIVDALMPGEERICKMPLAGSGSVKDKLVFETIVR